MHSFWPLTLFLSRTAEQRPTTARRLQHASSTSSSKHGWWWVRLTSSSLRTLKPRRKSMGSSRMLLSSPAMEELFSTRTFTLGTPTCHVMPCHAMSHRAIGVNTGGSGGPWGGLYSSIKHAALAVDSNNQHCTWYHKTRDEAQHAERVSPWRGHGQEGSVRVYGGGVGVVCFPRECRTNVEFSRVSCRV